MLFNSLAFVAFFPIVLAVYFPLKQQGQVLWLLLVSCVFYMWLIPNYILILILTVLVDFFAGILIENSTSDRRRKGILIVSIVSTCLILIAFKYFDFFQSNVEMLARTIGWNYSSSTLNMILPVGLSFHTFQSLSYVVEVYRGNQKAERHFPTYFLYVMFFPQLVAGPIERPQNLLHQFHEKHRFDVDRTVSGLKQIVVGLFMKVVIADRLAMIANVGFDHADLAPRPVLFLSLVAFAFQIYCDFAGYSTIAIGTARILGFDLMVNFKHPYLSMSVGEMWRRWHISLSTWFRDYVYLPLGGSRCGRIRWQTNLLVTFLLSGLWHGANWTYLIWGGLNGLFIVAENLVGRKVSTKGEGFSPVRVFFTFCLLCVTWVFFRARTVEQAFEFFHRMATAPMIGTIEFLNLKAVSTLNLVLGMFLILALWIIEWAKEYWPRLISEHALVYWIPLPSGLNSSSGSFAIGCGRWSPATSFWDLAPGHSSALQE